MAKRVVLIGHPVSHSLSGVLQQAAFDAARHRCHLRADGHAAHRAAGGDRGAPRRRVPGRQHHGALQGAGRAHGRPPHGGGPRDRRRRHDHPRGQPAGRATTPMCSASARRSTRWSASRRCPRRRSSWAPAAARAPSVYALITAGFQHVIVFNRHLHRGEAPGASTSPAARRTWSCKRQALARVGHRGGAGHGPRCSSTPAPSVATRRDAHPGRAAAAGPPGAGPALHAQGDPPAARGRVRPARRRDHERRRDAHPPERRRVRAVDRASGAHGRCSRERLEAARDEPRVPAAAAAAADARGSDPRAPPRRDTDGACAASAPFAIEAVRAAARRLPGGPARLRRRAGGRQGRPLAGDGGGPGRAGAREPRARARHSPATPHGRGGRAQRSRGSPARGGRAGARP